ncbi:MAG: phosphate ABC transporter ATP-binding protein [Anaerolineae bacterium]
MTSVYHLEHVTKQYNGRCVLHIDHLDVFAGEILGIIGPSGAGKSTLLRLLNFLELPTTGSITFGSYHSNGSSPPLSVRRQVTTVFQRPVLLNRSVTDNVAYGLRVRGQNHVEASVRGVLDQVGLTDLARAPAHTLSGGEAQRVALARALIIEPEALLLDEPTANLDPMNVNLIENITRDINQKQGTTIVLVTHNVFQARRLAHRVAFLLNGKLIETGPADRMFESPDDPRTAAFVRGDMVY